MQIVRSSLGCLGILRFQPAQQKRLILITQLIDSGGGSITDNPRIRCLLNNCDVRDTCIPNNLRVSSYITNKW